MNVAWDSSAQAYFCKSVTRTSAFHRYFGSVRVALVGVTAQCFGDKRPDVEMAPKIMKFGQKGRGRGRSVIRINLAAD